MIEQRDRALDRAMDIAEWLRGLGLDAYAPLFAANDIDASTLVLLTADDLKDMGIQSVGHRRKLLAALAELDSVTVAGQRTAMDPTIGKASERREVTVLFADIAGFTNLSTSLDPEQVHALLAQFFERTDAIILEHGGHIDKHIGDCVMGVFGAPVAHPDDMQRAVRAASKIHAAVSQISEAGLPKLQAHVGLATGEVVASTTGSASFHEYTVTGETVNLASRLCALAHPGETIISEAIQRNLAGEIVAEPAGVQNVKGFASPIVVSRLIGLSEHDAGRRPLFGRKVELAQCMTTLEVAGETGRGAVVTVRGEAGIGKSRLTEEVALKARAKGWRVGLARILEFTAGSTSDALSALGHELLLALSEAETGAAFSVPALAERPDLPPELRFAIEEFGGVERSPEEHRRLSAMSEQARMITRHESLAALAIALAARQPQLLIVEDIHWASEATLAGLELLVQRATSKHPIVVALTTRAEGDPTRRPEFLAGSRGLTIDLGPLAEDEARAHAVSILAGVESQVERCIARAEGNPLFLEQLARHAVAGGLEAALPSSIRSAVLARLDRLTASQKQVLQAAAVLGDQFPAEALRHVAEQASLDLAGLLDARLIVRGGETCRFAHALIREGVYGSLLHSTRERLHRRAADWYRGRDLALRAEHLGRAKAPEAVDAYLEAAHALIGQYRTDLALDLVDRAKAIALTAEDRFRVALSEGDYLLEVGRASDAIVAYETAIASARDGVDRATALLGKASALRVVDRLAEAMQLIEEAAPALTESQRVEQLAKLEHLRGNLYFPLGQRDACEAAHAQALIYAKAAGDPELQARALGGLADAAYAKGLYLTAGQRLDNCIALAREHGLGRVEVANLPMLAAVHSYVGHGGKTTRAAIEAAKGARQLRAELIALHIAMVGSLWGGTPEQVAVEFRRAQDIVHQLGARRFEPENLIFMADAERQLGNWTGARELVDRATAINREHGFVYFAAIVQGCRALAYHDDERVRRGALDEGMRLIQAESIAHDPLFYAYFGIEACLSAGDVEGTIRLCDLIDSVFAVEPSRFTRMLSERGRLIASAIASGLSPEVRSKLQRCRDEAAAMHYHYFTLMIDQHLAAAAPSKP
jgi:class 3 adenylate cyclase/tetratricopeptide (TPR) repeat protein